jgi:hypothetical protein
MTKDELITALNNDNDFGDFHRVVNPLHPCPDICAMLLLHKLVPRPRGAYAIAWAVTGHIHFNVDLDKLASVITEDEVRTLAFCGVTYQRNSDGLEMGV